MKSHRWISSTDFDVDAYCLADSRWMLFAYVKKVEAVGDECFWKGIASRFDAGAVAFVSRSLKTDKLSEPLEPIAIGDDPAPSEVWCKDGWIRLRLETEKVLNPGLFLDQALNRAALAERVQAAYARKTLKESDALLNLFSYTGSFTVSAFGAGIKSSTSVDLSARYLEWEKATFEANFGGLDLEHRLVREDAREFLKRAVKRGSRYRWIVIDPPTFARTDKKVFKVQDELPRLMEDSFKCLTPGGAMLVSTNDSRWHSRDFFSMTRAFAAERELSFEAGSTPAEFGAAHPLKSAWLSSVESNA